MSNMRALSVNLWRNNSNYQVVVSGAAATKFNQIGKQAAFATKSRAVPQANVRENSSAATTATTVTQPELACPHLAANDTTTTSVVHETAEWQNALPYNEIPGPKPIPILGNTWRWFSPAREGHGIDNYQKKSYKVLARKLSKHFTTLTRKFL